MIIFTKEKIVVTSGLPYSNGELHLGHIVSTYLPADIFVRYQRLKGNNIIFVCGGDDYGTPILIKAEKDGKSPEEYVEFWHKQHKKDFNDAGISFDFYYQTHSPENIKLSQHFFTEANKKGFIFTKTVEQPYCEHDKKFLPDRYVKGTCPFCKAKDQYSDGCEKCGRTFEPKEILEPKCAICGRIPVHKESLHYFFKLSAFSKQLKGWLNKNQNLQDEVKNYVLNWVDEGLRDWDITRDISWGVPIPLAEAKGKVLYGWFENHVAYIAFAEKYLKDKGIDGKKFWNDSNVYHFVGKDIVYHHYLFLPAERIAEGSYRLPDFIPTRGHLMLEGQKFSKSRGWYVSLREFLDVFPADYLRYYLASITPCSQADVNFDWKEFQAKINNELVANIGNFIHRTLTFVWNNFDGKVPKAGKKDKDYLELEKAIKEMSDKVAKKIEKNELDKALKDIVDFSALCNRYFQKKEPWKTKDESALFLCINAVRTLAIVLEPYTPLYAEKLWKQLNLKGSVGKQKWGFASEISIKYSHEINKPEILFNKVEDEKISEQISKLK